MKNTRIKPSHRILAVFFTITFLQTLIPYNQLQANNNGPNAPEAAAFEPVDATDMVNLLTGDFSYVLPLLNVPSPEGGYPLALAYHAGIAMDQEASWVGLGWSLNPGAINRSVNGYADDYMDSPLSEYFYDEGGSESVYSLSVGYSAVVSVGVGFSWGSNMASSGYISMGVGIPVGSGNVGVNYSGGSAGSSLGIGYTSTSGLSLGASISSSGSLSGNVGYLDTNSLGFSVGASTDGAYSASISKNNKNGNNFSLGYSLSSSGVGVNASVINRSKGNATGGIGIGLNVAANNAASTGDYVQKTTGYNIPIMVPTPVGFFSLSFGKQKFRYYLSKNEYNFVSGPLNFSQNIANNTGYKIHCSYAYGQLQSFDGVVASEEERDATIDYWGACSSCACTVTNVELSAFMDTYEINLLNPKVSRGRSYDVDRVTNSMVFPAYDKYNVQAQGLSGSISAKYSQRGGLFGLSGKETPNRISFNYVNHQDDTMPAGFRFTQKPIFHFDNEIGSYINVNHGDYLSTPFNYVTNPGYDASKITDNRQRKASYIEHFTNGEIRNNYNILQNKGYLKPSAMGFSRNSFPSNGIGAFKITAADGKTYHYSLPVYNHEIVTRTYGHILGKPNQNQAYIEKRQLQPYATHWLLTAVTGPDYMDNGDGIANDGDLGYWTSFEYGKWSDAFAWKTPYDKDFIEHTGNKNIKTTIRGRKQIYYLNKIKTRTHTALFVKSERNDAKSIAWSYKSVFHIDNYHDNNSGTYTEKFNIPSQKQLKLDKIILLKNHDANGITAHGIHESKTSDNLTIRYNQSPKEEELVSYNCYENVINPVDVDAATLNINKAIKVVDFGYRFPSASLARNTPNTENTNEGRLTLDKVYFNGKENVSILPPYRFGYKNNFNYNIDNQGQWGYHYSIPSQWSLNEITLPQGAKIKIDYEKHHATSSVNHELVFSNQNAEYFTAKAPDFSDVNDVSNKKVIISAGKNTMVPIALGDKVRIKYGMEEEHKTWINGERIWRGANYPCLNGKEINAYYDGLGTITKILANNSYEVTFDGNINLVLSDTGCADWQAQQIENSLNGNYTGDYTNLRSWTIQDWEHVYRPISIIFDATDKVFEIADARVKSITLKDNSTEIKTNYTYGSNGNGVGRLSYLPYASELEQELPHSKELPPAQVMYEYVTVEPNAQEGISNGKIQYKFEVFPKKPLSEVENVCSFGDLYEVKSKRLAGGDVDPRYGFTNPEHANEFEIKDKLAQIGRLLEVSTFNSKGQLIKKTINNYLTENEIASNAIPNIGVTEEAYISYKKVDYNRPSTMTNRTYFSSSKRIKYPNILKSTTEIGSGFKYETNFLDYNLPTGESLEQITSDSQNNELRAKTIPAFTIPEYSNNTVGYSMGSKADNSTNKNMLVQNAANLRQIKIGSVWKTIGANITTWNNQWTYRSYDGIEERPTNNSEKIWRKHKTYTWKGNIDTDGAYLGYTGDFDDFKWGVNASQSNTNWINTSTISLYDHYSMPLENEDINGNKISTKMGSRRTKVIAISNAGYNEMFYSGGDSGSINPFYLSGEVKAQGEDAQGSLGIGVSNVKAHTGRSSIRLSSEINSYEVVMKPNEHREGTYKISVWVDKENENNARIYINDISKAFNGEKVTAGNWVLLTHYEELEENQEYTIGIRRISGNIILYADDFRIHPIESSMTSYVYNEWDELNYIIGANNLATKYEYDAAGRLHKTYVEVIDTNEITGGFKLSKEINYNYDYVAETIDPLYMHLGIGNPDVSNTIITAQVIGGSGNYEYRWAIGSNPLGLTYGAWTTANTKTLNTQCGTGGRRYYKCEVRDKNYTEMTTENTGSHQRGNCSGGGGPILDPVDQ